MSYRIWTPIYCVALALAGPALAVPASPNAAVEELMDADRQFSSDAAGDNIVDGIAAMLAPDAISPTPAGTFARGKDEIVALLRANPNNATATAEWAPVRGGISADGQQGFTYGFQIIHDAGKPDRRAKYLAYWVKRPEGWRVFGYKRAGSPPGSVSTTVRAPALPPVMIPARPSSTLQQKYADELAARESAFSARAQAVGLRHAFIEFGSSDAMNFGGGSDFTFGNVNIGNGFPPDPTSPLTWAADEAVKTSSTGDLGITFGFIRQTGQPGAFPFFTVWRRDRTSARWLYVAE
jgi:ketosteroid isomerase-like protein